MWPVWPRASTHSVCIEGTGIRLLFNDSVICWLSACRLLMTTLSLFILSQRLGSCKPLPLLTVIATWRIAATPSHSCKFSWQPRASGFNQAATFPTADIYPRSLLIFDWQTVFTESHKQILSAIPSSGFSPMIIMFHLFLCTCFIFEIQLSGYLLSYGSRICHLSRRRLSIISWPTHLQ